MDSFCGCIILNWNLFNKTLKQGGKTGYNLGMLTNLNISNIVLIEKLNLEFGGGLNVLTGETGAGKSILLDALSLALGARSDAGLVRHGCDMASVAAEFDAVPDTLLPLFADFGIDVSDGTLILRRWKKSRMDKRLSRID